MPRGPTCCLHAGKVEDRAEVGAIAGLVEVLSVGGEACEAHIVQHRRGVVEGGGSTNGSH